MHNCLVTLLLLLATLAHTQSSCDPNTPTYYTTAETYIYQRAKTSSAIGTKVPQGEIVYIIDSDDYPNPNMWHICHKGKAGYALKKLLSYDKVEPGQNHSIDPDILNQGIITEKRNAINDRISALFEPNEEIGLVGAESSYRRSTGAGSIGGGLENRGGAGPAIEESFQEQGQVVIRLCVNSSGQVISADYTHRGSTTQSRTLIALAKKNAMLYSFNASSSDKQCGTISYNFRNDQVNDPYEALGRLSRQPISSPPISDLLKSIGRVVVKVCINQGGRVVYTEFDKSRSTLTDIGHSQRALAHVRNMVFEKDDSAPAEECGLLTFIMTASGYALE